MKTRNIALASIVALGLGAVAAWAAQTNYLGTIFIADPTTPTRQLQVNSDGSINATVISGGTSPGGLNTQVQYNNNTAFGGITGATTDGTTLTLVAPILGTPASGVATNITGTAAGLTAGNVTTNANLTGPITSVGNATSIASQTGTGTTFVTQVSPSLTTPNINVATGTSLALGGATIGTNALAVTGTSNFAGLITGNAGITITGGTAITGSALVSTGDIQTSASGQFYWSGRTTLASPVNGSVLFSNFAGTAGVTISFPTASATPTFQFGAADAAVAVAQTTRVQSVVAGTAAANGANWILIGSLPTGTGTSGDIIIQTGVKTGSGTTQGTPTTALTIKGESQSVILASTTDSTTTTSGALQVAGGFAVRKRVFIDGISASAGLQTAVLCQSSGGEMIADSVACLASSEDVKEDIKPSDIGLAQVLAMRPILYRYQKTGNERFDNAPNQRAIHAGLGAKQLEAIDPRLVAYDVNGKIRTVRQEGVQAALVNAVQEQERRIETIKADNDNLRAAVRELKRMGGDIAPP